MREEINIYCDESCHLQNDGIDVMAIGAVWCRASVTGKIADRIKHIKLKHQLKPSYKKNNSLHIPAFEVKWHKLSNSKIQFYEELIDFFFDDDELHFNVLVVRDKSSLNHEKLAKTHDGFYYMSYFNMLKTFLDPLYSHNIYLDIKDTKSNEKVVSLKDILSNSSYDLSKRVVKKIQQVRSHEVELVQLADLLVGAIAYIHRGLNTSKAKVHLLEHIKKRSNYGLLKSTLVTEKKMNILVWQPYSN